MKHNSHNFLGLKALIFLLSPFGLISCTTSVQIPKDVKILAHRGVHQTYSAEGLDRDTCTANRIDPPKHAFIENTIPSMLETIKLGADIIEIDIHPTIDGDFAVFHDWALDCRTQASGVTRQQSIKFLKTLDVGYGYTADGGKTFPLRGKGIGMMPNLAQVLEATGNTQILINIKSRDPKEGELLAKYLKAHGTQSEKIVLFGDDLPINSFHQFAPEFRSFTKETMKECTKQYILNAWRGGSLDVCRNGVMGMPVNYRFLFFGRNKSMIERLNKINAQIYVMGNMSISKGQRMIGIDDPKYLKYVPDGAVILTNKIEEIGPYLKARK